MDDALLERLDQLNHIRKSGLVAPENIDYIKGLIAETERSMGITRYWL